MSTSAILITPSPSIVISRREYSGDEKDKILALREVILSAFASYPLATDA